MEIFTTEFGKFDPWNTGYIALEDVRKLVELLPPPLGRENPGLVWMRVLRHELRVLVTQVHGKVFLMSKVLMAQTCCCSG